MPANTAAPKTSTFECDHPNCQGMVFANKSNLNRHKLAVHGEKTPLPCGKLHVNRSDNARRHRKDCDGCKRASQMPPASAGNDSATSTILGPAIQDVKPQHHGVPQSSHVPIYQQNLQPGYQQDYQQPLEDIQQSFQGGYQQGHHQSLLQDYQQPLEGYQQSYENGYQHGYPYGYQ